MMADGLGVRIRARSFTRIDQTSGSAACWSRTAYYAGLAPSGGMEFPEDVAVLPLEVNRDQEETPPARALVWDEQRQHLASGWLGSRTPTQYLLLRSRQSKAQLRFIEAAESSELPKIENALGTRIRHLVLFDPEGQVYTAANVPSGAVRKLSAANAGSAFSKLRSEWVRNMPALPEGFDPNNYGGYFGNRRYYYGANYNNMPTASQSTGLLETNISFAVASPPLGPRTYVALVDRSPEVNYGLEDFQEEDSFHVIVGNW
jgi:hypothetical protein